MNETGFRLPGHSATLRGVGRRVWWALPTVVVRDSPALIALYLPTGAQGKNVHKRPTPQDLLAPETLSVVDFQWHRTNVLMLIVPGDAFSTYAMWDAASQELLCWYINLQEPIRRTALGYDTMDHMLDVVVNPAMREWRWKDEDEFNEAARVGIYPPEKASAIRAEGERAIRLVMSERRSAYLEWAQWKADPAWELPVLSPDWER